jgi:hypothetical protein
MAKTIAKNAEKKEAESQETPKVASEEPKGTRYLTKPVRLADLPRLAGRKPIDPSKRLFLKLTFVALAAPGSFAVMPGRGFGAYPICDGPGGELCGLEPDQPQTGCDPPETNTCTEVWTWGCNPATGWRNGCNVPAGNNCTQNACGGDYTPTANSCGTAPPGTPATISASNECSGTPAAGGNQCNATQGNYCVGVAAANKCTGTNVCNGVGPPVGNACNGVAGANTCLGSNTCNPAGANTCTPAGVGANVPP